MHALTVAGRPVVDVIEALAGTGKTYTAGAPRELYAGAGCRVVGVLPSARAARELAVRAGSAARTLDSRPLAIGALTVDLPLNARVTARIRTPAT